MPDVNAVLPEDAPAWTEADLIAYAARAGLPPLEAEPLARLLTNANKVAAAGRMLPRMPRKEDEPAHRTFWPAASLPKGA